MVEFLVVAFILGVGLLGLTALMATNVRAASGGRQRDTAAYLAHEVMESLAADGRLTAQLRSNGQTAFAASYLLANAGADTPVVYSVKDAGGTARTTFDLDGRPSLDRAIFSVNWVRRTQNVVPAAASASMSAEVVVNVSWQESTTGTATTQKWLSFSRVIRY
ncbi:MAG: hypothetical protein HGB30_10560 [Holophagaceae bacterium]|nr:hypothetical protein [Holophagaceae bacterium]